MEVILQVTGSNHTARIFPSVSFLLLISSLSSLEGVCDKECGRRKKKRKTSRSQDLLARLHKILTRKLPQSRRDISHANNMLITC